LVETEQSVNSGTNKQSYNSAARSHDSTDLLTVCNIYTSKVGQNRSQTEFQ